MHSCHLQSFKNSQVPVRIFKLGLINFNMFIIYLVLALTSACSQIFDVSEASLTSMVLYDSGTTVGSQFTGNGFVGVMTSSDSAVWEINSSEAGQTAISFRYLLESSARSL